MLYLIGLGISPIKTITLQGLKILKNSDFVFIEKYTCNLNADYEELQKQINKKIIFLQRKDIEKEDNILIKKSFDKNVCFLVGGDPLSATTHKELLIEARKNNIECKIIHNSSIITAVAECGLELYKFGRIISIPFPDKNYAPTSPYNYLEENLKNQFHTLVLLDINMTPKIALNQLIYLESKIKHKIIDINKKIIVCKNLGAKNQNIAYIKIKNIINQNYEEISYCLVIPSKLNFKEKEYLDLYL